MLVNAKCLLSDSIIRQELSVEAEVYTYVDQHAFVLVTPWVFAYEMVTRSRQMLSDRLCHWISKLFPRHKYRKMAQLTERHSRLLIIEETEEDVPMSESPQDPAEHYLWPLYLSSFSSTCEVVGR